MTCSGCGHSPITPTSARILSGMGAGLIHVSVGYECPNCGRLARATKLKIELTPEEEALIQRIG